jgi:hypothetical protein
MLERDPVLVTTATRIADALRECVDSLDATGNSEKQVQVVESRITKIIAKAKFSEYAHLDQVKVIKAVALHDQQAAHYRSRTAFTGICCSAGRLVAR